MIQKHKEKKKGTVNAIINIQIQFPRELFQLNDKSDNASGVDEQVIEKSP